MWILQKNLLLFGGALILAVLAGAAAFAIGPNDSPDPRSDREINRKSGDMYVFYGGRGYYRSARMTSPMNRSFRGGGLHGGK